MTQIEFQNHSVITPHRVTIMPEGEHHSNVLLTYFNDAKFALIHRETHKSSSLNVPIREDTSLPAAYSVVSSANNTEHNSLLTLGRSLM